MLHLHVPRASGSSLSAWLHLALGKGQVAHASSPDGIKTLAASRAKTGMPTVISGHFPFGVHEHFDQHPYCYLLLLREPVQRVLSLFRYIRNQPSHQLYEVLNRDEMTIARFYAERLPGSGSRNAMVAQLGGLLGFRVLLQVEHLEIAWNRLKSDRVMYGLSEQPANVLEQAARFFSIEQPPIFPEVNRPAPQKPWGGSEADIAAIAAANQLDIALYERAANAYDFGKHPPRSSMAGHGLEVDVHRQKF